MKKHITLIVFIATTLASGQSILTKGNVTKTDKKINYPVFIEETNKGDFITVSVNKNPTDFVYANTYFVSKYDGELSLQSEIKLQLDKYSVVKGLSIKNDTVYVIEYYRNRKNKTLDFNLHFSHINTLEFKKRKLTHIDEDYGNTYSGFQNTNQSSLNNGRLDSKNQDFSKLIFSKDKKLFAITFEIWNQEKQANKVLLFDDDFNMIFHRDFKDELKERLFDISDITLIKDRVYLLVKRFLSNRRDTKVDGKPNYNFQLIELSKTSEKLMSIETGNNYINDLKLFENKEEVFLLGYYSNINDNKQQGVFVSKLDISELRQSSTAKSAFPDSFFQEENATNKNFTSDYHFRDLYRINDSYFTVSEVNYYDGSVLQGSKTKTQDENLRRFENIMISKFDDTFNLLMTSVIRRDSKDSAALFPKSFNSVLSFNKNDKIHVFVKGEKKQKKGLDFFKPGKKGKVHEFIFDTDLDSRKLEHELFSYYSIPNMKAENDFLVVFSPEKSAKKLVKISPN